LETAARPAFDAINVVDKLICLTDRKDDAHILREILSTLEELIVKLTLFIGHVLRALLAQGVGQVTDHSSQVQPLLQRLLQIDTPLVAEVGDLFQARWFASTTTTYYDGIVHLGLAHFIAIGVITALVGGFMCVMQHHLKRMLAFATVAHGGLFLVGVALVTMVFGMVMEGLPAAVVLIPVVFPIATRIGIHPIHFDIVQTAAVGIGLFLPPMGVGLLMALRFAKVGVGQHARTYWPYLLALLVGLLLIICVPVLSLAIPRIAGFVHGGGRPLLFGRRGRRAALRA